MTRAILVIISSGIFSVFTGCEKNVPYVLSTSYPTPTPSFVTTEDKEENWKIIENMRKGIVPPTPTPTPAVVPHLIMGGRNPNYIAPRSTRESMADEERNRAASEVGVAPETGGLWGISLYVHDAIKSVLRDPDSYKFESVDGPWSTIHNGTRCWLEKVHFRARNGFGGYSADTANVWVVVRGSTGGREYVLDVTLSSQ